MRPVRLGFYVFASVLVLSPMVRHGSVDAAQATQSPPILAKRVRSLNVRGLCVVDALLRLGQQEHIPLGIEYLAPEALEKPIAGDFHNTTVGGILEGLLGGGKGYTWRVREGVLEVSHRSVASGEANLLDRVLPSFVIRRCSVADASNALYMSLNSQLHPEVTGYAGDYNPGDPQDLIGPLELRNAPVRSVLNRLVSSANKKAAWVVQVPPGHLDELPTGGLWTIVEYETPPRQYAAELLRRVSGR